jgi:FkbM family methyltransferase
MGTQPLTGAGASLSRIEGRLGWARRRLEGETALAVADALVPAGGVVVDAGADVGFFTLRFAELVGPAGRVHAFEPNPRTRANIEALMGAEPQVTVHPVALADAPGSAELHVPIEDGEPVGALGRLSRRHEGPSETVTVRTATLDESLGADAERVAFIKCDVEGAELAVLRGAQRTLECARPALLVEIEYRHAGNRMGETLDLLARLDYAAWALGPSGIVPLAEFDLERDQLAYLDGGLQEHMPAAYVHDFLFTPPGQDRPSIPRASAVMRHDASQE